MALNDGFVIIIAMGPTRTSGSRKNMEDGHERFRSSIVRNLEVLQTRALAMTRRSLNK
jgi:hypothetical protein